MAIREGNVRLQVTVSEATLNRIDEICKEMGVSRSWVVTFAIREMSWDYLQRKMTERREKESSEE